MMRIDEEPQLSDRVARLRDQLQSTAWLLSAQMSRIADILSADGRRRRPDGWVGATEDAPQDRQDEARSQDGSASVRGDQASTSSRVIEHEELAGGSATATPPVPPISSAFTIENVINPKSEPAVAAGRLARSLVTARGLNDLGAYVELLAEIQSELRGDLDDNRRQFHVALIGALSLIAAVLVRSAELSGLTTETGQPLLAELFQRLDNDEAVL